MVLCRGDDISGEDVWQIHLDFHLFNKILVGVEQIIWLASLYLIFVHNYKRKKQAFVKVIWILISLTEINLAVINYCL